MTHIFMPGLSVRGTRQRVIDIPNRYMMSLNRMIKELSHIIRLLSASKGTTFVVGSIQRSELRQDRPCWQEINVQYLCLFCSPTRHFWIVAENRKCTEWSYNDIDHLMFNSIQYALNSYPRGPNLCQFHSTTNHFLDTSLSKMTSPPNDFRMTLGT